MVSKNPKKASSKIPVHHRLRRIAPKNKAAMSHLMSLAATINRVVRYCRPRLVEVFTRFVILGAAQHHISVRRLNSIPKMTFHFLPMPSSPEKKTIFLDLDETLIHSTTNPSFGDSYHFVVQPTFNGRVVPYYVLKRPGAEDLLRVAAANFEVVVFTAGVREYASLILDHLDPCGQFISHRLYRDACKKKKGRLVKDLSTVGRPLNRVVLVDDNPNSYFLQPQNALPVAPFFHDLADQELLRVTEFLQVALSYDDMRDALAHYRSNYDNRR